MKLTRKMKGFIIIVILIFLESSSLTTLAAIDLISPIRKFTISSKNSPKDPVSKFKKESSYKTVLPTNFKWSINHKKTYKLFNANGIKHGELSSFNAGRIAPNPSQASLIKDLTARYSKGLFKKRKIILNWTYQGKTEVKYYNIYRKLGDEEWQQIGKIASTETKYEDMTINKTGTYFYRVCAFYNKNNSNMELSNAEISITIK